ncbi:hypothetical protein F8388_025027 [Cannabis sativa]|uniref:DUF4283 domain-containing protein n=1 Tax=Cannabis sativa TaxID=3483 RepID=A0A7J6G3J9_CANSA|nr:hypothetical protein F8388_025027 [Cannabis sativa]
MERVIHIEAFNEEMNKTLQRDSELEMERMELFEDITLEEVVSNKAYVGKVIGCKDMPASVVKKILIGVWQRLGPWRMKKCEDGVMGFFFEEEEDCNFVMENRPWIVNGVILNLKPWPVEGEVQVAEFEVARLWVQFHGLPTRCLSNANVPVVAKKVGSFVKDDSKSKEEVVRRGFLRAWIDSETGRTNYFNHAGRGSTKLIADSDGIPEWELRRNTRRGTWKRKTGDTAPELNSAIGKGKGKITQADQMVAPGKRSAYVAKKVQSATPTTVYPIDRGSTSGTKCISEFEKRGNVGDGGIPDNVNVINEVNNGIQLNSGPEVLELPRPDFVAVDDNNELIPDIGPTIAQSLEIPHNRVCLSQKPHCFPEPTPIAWPNLDPEAQQTFSKLYGPEYLNLYKAQQSLLSNPPNLLELIMHLLGNSRKRKAHTWFQLYPSSLIQDFNLKPAVELEVGSTSEEGLDGKKFVIGAGDDDVPANGGSMANVPIRGEGGLIAWSRKVMRLVFMFRLTLVWEPPSGVCFVFLNVGKLLMELGGNLIPVQTNLVCKRS